MKKTLFLAAILSVAFASQATAGVWGDNYYINNSTGDNTNTYVSPNVAINYGTEEDPIVPYDSTTGTYTLDSTNANSTFVNLRRGDAASTTITSFTIGDSMTISTWNGGFTGLTIQALTGNGSSAFTNQNGNTVAVNAVTGVDSVTNAGVLTLGTAASTNTFSGTITNTGTLTLLGNITFDVSSMAGYTVTDSSAMSAPEAGTNGFESGSATYALVSGAATTTGATITTTDSDEVTISESQITITKTGTGTKYYIQNGSSVSLSSIQAAGTVTDVVVNSGTLTLDATGVGLNKITGTGNVNVTTATSLTGSLASAATGTLTVTGVTLSVGSGQAETNSLSSFGTVNLAGGTISYNNSKDTLNNVTVASGSKGTINSYDMGTGTFTLAGTTNIAGELTIQNLYNAQFTIEKVTGAGTLSIKGTNGGDVSTEAATYALGDMTGFTGTIAIGNSKATVSQTFDSIAAMSAAGEPTYTVTGGTVVKTCTAGISGDTDLGTATGTISGAVTGGTITGGTGDITLSGAISDSTIDGKDHVSIASTSISNSTLNDVTLSGSQRKNISGTITIGDMTNDATGGTYSYALVGNGEVTLIITGTADTTKTSAGAANSYSNIGLGTGSTITVKSNASLTAGRIYNSTSSNVSTVTVEENGTLTATDASTIGTLINAGTTKLTAANTNISSLTNSGTLTLDGATTINTVTLNGGTITLGSEESHDNDLTISDLTVSGTGSEINANLVMTTGSLTFVGSATLDMGCDVTISDDVKVFLDKSVIDQTDPNKFITLVNISDTENSTINVGSNTVYVYYMDGENEVMTDRTLAYNATTGVIYATPEPATATLSLLALAGLAARRRRK